MASELTSEGTETGLLAVPEVRKVFVDMQEKYPWTREYVSSVREALAQVTELPADHLQFARVCGIANRAVERTLKREMHNP